MLFMYIYSVCPCPPYSHVAMVSDPRPLLKSKSKSPYRWESIVQMFFRSFAVPHVLLLLCSICSSSFFCEITRRNLNPFQIWWIRCVCSRFSHFPTSSGCQRVQGFTGHPWCRLISRFTYVLDTRLSRFFLLCSNLQPKHCLNIQSNQNQIQSPARIPRVYLAACPCNLLHFLHIFVKCCTISWI